MSMCFGVEARTGWDYSADGRKMPMVKSGWHGNRIAVYQGDKQGSKHVFTGLCNDGVCSYWVFIQQTLNMDWLLLRLSCGNDKLQDSWTMRLMTHKELCVSKNWLCTGWIRLWGSGEWTMILHKTQLSCGCECRCSWGNLIFEEKAESLIVSRVKMLYLQRCDSSSFCFFVSSALSC